MIGETYSQELSSLDSRYRKHHNYKTNIPLKNRGITAVNADKKLLEKTVFEKIRLLIKNVPCTNKIER